MRVSVALHARESDRLVAELHLTCAPTSRRQPTERFARQRSAGARSLRARRRRRPPGPPARLEVFGVGTDWVQVTWSALGPGRGRARARRTTDRRSTPTAARAPCCSTAWPRTEHRIELSGAGHGRRPRRAPGHNARRRRPARSCSGSPPSATSTSAALSTGYFHTIVEVPAPDDAPSRPVPRGRRRRADDVGRRAPGRSRATSSTAATKTTGQRSTGRHRRSPRSPSTSSPATTRRRRTGRRRPDAGAVRHRAAPGRGRAERSTTPASASFSPTPPGPAPTADTIADVGRPHRRRRARRSTRRCSSGCTTSRCASGSRPTSRPGFPGPKADRSCGRLGEANPTVLVSSGHTHRHRRHHVGPVTATEVGSTKDFPGTWAGYQVHEGGIVQFVRRIAEPSCIRWTDQHPTGRGRRWALWSPGRLAEPVLHRKRGDHRQRGAVANSRMPSSNPIVGPETEHIGGPVGRRHDVADVAQPVAADDLRWRRRRTHRTAPAAMSSTVWGSPLQTLNAPRTSRIGEQGGHVGVRRRRARGRSRVAGRRPRTPAGTSSPLQRRPEDAGHAGVGRVPRHPGPVDVVVAQRHDGSRRARARTPSTGAPGGAWWRRRRCAGRAGASSGTSSQSERRTAHRARWFEPTGLEVGDRPGAGPDHAVLVAAVATLAVHDHRRRQHDPAGEAELVQDRQPDRGADVVVGDVVADVGEVDPEADAGRLVADGVDAVEGAAPGIGVAARRASISVDVVGGGRPGAWGGRGGRGGRAPPPRCRDRGARRRCASR